MGVRCKKESSYKEGKIRLDQCLIYLHPFRPLSPPFSYLPLFNSVAPKNIPGKNIEGPFALLASHPHMLHLWWLRFLRSWIETWTEAWWQTCGRERHGEGWRLCMLDQLTSSAAERLLAVGLWTTCAATPPRWTTSWLTDAPILMGPWPAARECSWLRSCH